jgi:hypothetical protein
MAPRILIAGGYGFVGSAIARHVRRISKDVEIILAGRNRDSGKALAAELGNASVAHLDIDALDTLPAADLIVSALYDPANALLHAALAKGAAHIGITTKAEDVAPVVFATLQTPPKRPIVLLGYSAAGAAMVVAKKAALEFSQIHSITITALFDTRDEVGPMTANDAEFLIGRALIRSGGKWGWVDGAQHPRSIALSGGQDLQAYPTGLLDVPGLAAMTNAADVRVDLVEGTSLGTLAGRRASSDAFIDIAGVTTAGTSVSRRTVVSDPNGLAHFTALGVLIAVERVLGLDAAPPPPGGLYVPETLVSPDAALARLAQFGVQVESERHDARSHAA